MYIDVEFLTDLVVVMVPLPIALHISIHLSQEYLLASIQLTLLCNCFRFLDCLTAYTSLLLPVALFPPMVQVVLMSSLD